MRPGDRELLVLAARAADIDAVPQINGWGMIQRDALGGPEHWNPLTDDGDALRLAVDFDGAHCVAISQDNKIAVIDKCVRRAIVLAAAQHV